MEEVKFWENAVVCYVTSANPPLHVVERCRIWKDLLIDKIGMVNRGVFFCSIYAKRAPGSGM